MASKKTTDEIEEVVIETTGEVIPAPEGIIQIIAAITKEAGALEPVQTKGVPFPFRGIDGTVNHLSRFLQKYGVVVTPRVLEHRVTARELDKGRAITQTEVLVEYTFHAPDGTSLSVTTAGLAQDYADRSTAQAQSVAFRVALLQTFTLPTMSPEPEAAGEDTQAYIKNGAATPPPATRAQASVEKAGSSLPAIRAKVKGAAGTKGLTSAQINEIGVSVDPDFFGNAEALEKVLEKINALPNKE